jgi:hypothetical protein
MTEHDGQQSEAGRDWDSEAFALLSSLSAPRVWPHVAALVLLPVLMLVLLPTSVFLSFACYLAMLTVAVRLSPLVRAFAATKLRSHPDLPRRLVQ